MLRTYSEDKARPAIVGFMRSLCYMPVIAAGLGLLHCAVALEDVTLIDGTGAAPRAHVCIVIDDGRIQAIVPAGHAPKGSTRIPLSGRTVMPGIINAHGHLGLTQPSYNAENIER